MVVIASSSMAAHTLAATIQIIPRINQVAALNGNNNRISTSGPATVTITGGDRQSQANASTLSGRDASSANQSLKNTLTLQDTARLQESLKTAQQNQQAAQMVGAVLDHVIGDVAQKNGWAEGSAQKVLLHGLSGAIQAGVAGGGLTAGVAAGAANEALIPLMTDYLKAQGVSEFVRDAQGNTVLNPQFAELLKIGSTLVGAAAGVAAGGGSANTALGASVGLTGTMYNRLLHPDEKQRIKDLADGDAQKEARLTAAACALVKCYAEYSENSVTYNALKAMADAGNSDALGGERQQLQAQQGLFAYSTQGLLSDGNVDAAKQLNNTYQVTTRALGAGQAVLGGLGVAGSVATAPVACATGVGCVANAAVAGLSVDAVLTGARQAVSGQPENTSLNQALQGLGLSPEAAGYAEFALGVGAAAKVGSVVNAATASQAAKLSYEDIAKLGTKGVNVTSEVLQTPQAKALIAEYQAAGNGFTDAQKYAVDVTGQTLPTVRAVAANEELIKVVPKSAMVDDGVSKFSPYFMTRTEYDALSKLSPTEIGQRLGLPAEQGVRGAQLGFEAYSITPKPGATPKVFTSTVAPVEQGAYNAVGGAEQTIVPNRSLWTDPKSIGSIGGVK